MLSLFKTANTPLNTFSNTKCAEVFCQTVEHFSIICTFCELKTFDFEDFMRHFKNVHLDHKDPLPDKQIKYETKDELELQENELQDMEELSATQDIKERILEELAEQQQTSKVNDAAGVYTGIYDNESDSPSETEEDEGGSKDEDYVPMVLKPQTPKETRTTSNHACSECGKSYKLAKSLQRHMDKAHSEGNDFKCSRCSCAFTSARALNSHQRSVHAGYPCSQCDKTYKSKEALHHHSFSHAEARNFVCDYENCGKSFYSPKNLSSHKRIVHSLERNYVCETCGFRTKSKPALVVHNRSHTGEKPFVCQVCERRFASQSLLGEHRAMHLKDRPHKCEVCGATFARAKALYHHKHLHLGIKKFLCKICGKTYAQAAGLSGHMRQHKSEQF